MCVWAGNWSASKRAKFKVLEEEVQRERLGSWSLAAGPRENRPQQ